MIKGFNKNSNNEVANKIGLNEDNKEELYVKNMPENLVLLCANDYVQDGVAVLFPDQGSVYRLDNEQKHSLIETLANYEIKN
jgi:hypothetical protein